MKRKLELAFGIFGIAAACFIAINLYVSGVGAKYIAASTENLPQVQAAIIPGAAVTQKGTPGAVLEDRIAMALSLYKQGKVSKILVSGSNGTLDYNEVDPVRKVLMSNQIPQEDIFLDHAGFDTYSTMYRAKAVFQVDSAIIVTQDFHLPRALYLARSMGIEAYGIPADRGTYTARNYFRELFSRPKAFFDVLIHRVPKYLGDPIPITGSGVGT
ncbi:MAG TPA: ElyC/SanA/YdcF family protein [Candidatus Paceibacterota bacterium]|jgi:SanA protein|nr:ElyC/SanA/YdcF family protein [Candidatus Paceibacterota bacterium]